MTDTIKANKNWFLGAGIILILLGAAAITVPIAASLALETLFGWIFVVGGLIKIVHSFRALNAGKCLFRLLVGVMYLAIGGMFLIHPLQGVLTLTLLLAILFMFEGVMGIAVAMRIRPARNWVLMLINAIASLILAAIIFSGFPGNVTWVIGLLVGINLIFSGWTMLMLSSSSAEVSIEA